MATSTSNSIRRADTLATDPTAAVAELDRSLDIANAALTVFFSSPSYSADKLAEAINTVAQGSTVIGCTSAGEIGSRGYQKQSISAFSLGRGDFTVAVESFSHVKDFSVDQAHQLVARAKANLQSQGIDPSDNKTFALLLVDGLSCSEEPLTYKLQDALHDIPLIGGSAGDGLDFGQTKIFHDTAFSSDSAVIALVHSVRPWEIFKEQHISPTDARLVVTDSDPDNRIINELNGEPAAQELARVIGLSSTELLTGAELAKHPLMMKMGGTWYIRSAHSVIENDAVKLFCAIEEGLVLSVGKTEDLPNSLHSTLTDIKQRLGNIELTIACDCILRRLELEGTGKTEAASQVLTEFNAIGFSTYGEQFGTVHVNQTLTGIVIG